MKSSNSKKNGPLGRDPRVLLVDDHGGIRRSAVRFLRRAGFEVQAVPDGMTAIHLLMSGIEFDAAIVDLEMPSMDGIEVVQRLRELDPQLPMGIWSASDRLDNLEGSCAEVDFIQHKMKPVNELVKVVTGCIERLLAQSYQAEVDPDLPMRSGTHRRFPSGFHLRDEVLQQLERSELESSSG